MPSLTAQQQIAQPRRPVAAAAAPPRRRARASASTAPPPVRRAPRGSRSSSEGPAGIPAVYRRIGPRSRNRQGFCVDTKRIFAGHEWYLARDASAGGRAPAQHRRRSSSATTGAAILPPLSMTIARRRAVGGDRPQRLGQVDVRAHRAGAGAARRRQGRARARACASPTCRSSRRWTPSSRSRSLDFVLMGLQGPGQRHAARRGAPTRRARRRRAGRGGRAGARAAPAARPVGRAAAARADRARARDRRRPGVPRRADHRAGRRRRARGAGADRDAARQARRRGRDGHPPGRGRPGARRPRAAARPRPRRRAARRPRPRCARCPSSRASTAASSAAARRRRDRRRRRPVVARAVGEPRHLQGRDLGRAAWRARCWARSASTSCCAGWCSRRRRSRRRRRWASRCRSGSRRSIDPSGHAAGHAAGPAAHVAPSLLFEPVLWAIAASLLATLVFVAEPRAPAPDAREPARLRVPGQRRGRRHRRRQASRRRRTTWRRSCSAARSSCSRSISILVGGGDGRPAGRPRRAVARAAVRRLRPDGRARAGDAGARAQRRSCSCRSGLSVALCTRALGALPVFAFSVLPAMTALALTARIGLVFVLATLIGALSGVGGYVVSFRGDLPVGATQTATAAALLAAALRLPLRPRRATNAGAPGRRRRRGRTRRRSGRAAPARRRRRDRRARPMARRRSCAARSTISAAATDRLRLLVMPGIGMPNTTSAAAIASPVRPVVLVADHHRRRAREVQILDGRRGARHRRVEREAVGAQRRHRLRQRRVADDVQPLLAALRDHAGEPERLDALDHVDALDAERLGAAQHGGAVVRIVQVLDHHAQAAQARRRGARRCAPAARRAAAAPASRTPPPDRRTPRPCSVNRRTSARAPRPAAPASALFDAGRRGSRRWCASRSSARSRSRAAAVPAASPRARRDRRCSRPRNRPCRGTSCPASFVRQTQRGVGSMPCGPNTPLQARQPSSVVGVVDGGAARGRPPPARPRSCARACARKSAPASPAARARATTTASASRRHPPRITSRPLRARAGARARRAVSFVTGPGRDVTRSRHNRGAIREYPGFLRPGTRK